MSEDLDFDIFFHYDSASPALGDGKVMGVGVPVQGTYWLSLTNVGLDYTGYTPDLLSAFLVISNTEETQACNLCKIGAPQRGKLFFPLSDSSTKPNCRTYNKIVLRPSDRLCISYADKNGATVALTRIVATVHISNNADVIRLTL